MNQLIRQDFVSDIKSIITQSRETAIRSVDFQRVVMYWHIGKTIFEEEQQGQERAECGVGSFIKNSQLRPHCGRNSTEHIINCFGKKHKCRVYTFYKIEIATTPEALWQRKNWQP